MMNTEHTEHGEIARLIGDLRRAERERDSLRAQLATATASVQQLRADVELATAQRDAEACHRDDADAEAERVTRELAVLRAQQAPLVECVDALRAAATAAGWRDADATGETLVAWVRRGALGRRR